MQLNKFCKPSGEDLLVQLSELLTNFHQKHVDTANSILKEIVQAFANKIETLSTEIVSNLKEMAIVPFENGNLYSLIKFFVPYISLKYYTIHHIKMIRLSWNFWVGLEFEKQQMLRIEAIQTFYDSYQDAHQSQFSSRYDM